MNSLWRKIVLTAGVGWRLILKELRQNLAVFLSPLLFFIPIFIVSLINGASIYLGDKTTIVGLIVAFVFAVIFGLQSFAGETDRKTLDFLLSRPIAPTLLIIVKFVINLGIYLFWLLLISQRIVFDWSLLKLPKGVEGNAIGLIFPIIISMGFFAGLIARGAERLIVTVGMTGLMAGGCYFLWNQAFLLMAADFYWFDIPPHIVILVSRWIPGVLLLISLVTPLVFSLWFLRGRYAFYKFKPLRRLVSVWTAVALTIWIAVTVLGPAVWPIKIRLPYGGDWHPQSGVVICGSYFKTHSPVTSLYIAHIGGKARQIYHGTQIHSARWSPDGKRIAFVDGQWIKVWQKSGVQSVVKGSFPVWSHDGQSLAFIQKSDKIPAISQVNMVNLINKSVTRLYTTSKAEILGQAWDTARHKLYVIHEEKGDDSLEVIDLKTKKSILTISLTSSPTLYMQNPTLELCLDGTLLLGVAYEHTSRVSALYPGTKQLDVLVENKGQGIDMLSQSILSPAEEGYLVPRMDGAYDYKGYVIGHDHRAGDDDEEIHY